MTNTNIKLICKRLKDFLYGNNITNKSLSTLCGVSKKTISKWLNSDLIQTNALVIIKQEYPNFDIEYTLSGNNRENIDIDMLEKIIQVILATSPDINNGKISTAIASIYGILNSTGADNKNILINEKAVSLYLKNF